MIICGDEMEEVKARDVYVYIFEIFRALGLQSRPRELPALEAPALRPPTPHRLSPSVILRSQIVATRKMNEVSKQPLAWLTSPYTSTKAVHHVLPSTPITQLRAHASAGPLPILTPAHGSEWVLGFAPNRSTLRARGKEQGTLRPPEMTNLVPTYTDRGTIRGITILGRAGRKLLWLAHSGVEEWRASYPLVERRKRQ